MVPKTLRQKMTAKKRAEGKSLRQIGGELGISDGTVRNDLGTAQDYAVPDRIVGLDGRAQPATRQKKPPSRPGANKWSKRVEAISASVDMRRSSGRPRARDLVSCDQHGHLRLLSGGRGEGCG